MRDFLQTHLAAQSGAGNGGTQAEMKKADPRSSTRRRLLCSFGGKDRASVASCSRDPPLNSNGVASALHPNRPTHVVARSLPGGLNGLSNADHHTEFVPDTAWPSKTARFACQKNEEAARSDPSGPRGGKDEDIDRGKMMPCLIPGRDPSKLTVAPARIHGLL